MKAPKYNFIIFISSPRRPSTYKLRFADKMEAFDFLAFELRRDVSAWLHDAKTMKLLAWKISGRFGEQEK